MFGSIGYIYIYIFLSELCFPLRGELWFFERSSNISPTLAMYIGDPRRWRGIVQISTGIFWRLYIYILLYLLYIYIYNISITIDTGSYIYIYNYIYTNTHTPHILAIAGCLLHPPVVTVILPDETWTNSAAWNVWGPFNSPGLSTRFNCDWNATNSTGWCGVLICFNTPPWGMSCHIGCAATWICLEIGYLMVPLHIRWLTIYPLVNKHNYGKWPSFMGKSTINGHFQ